MPSHSFPLEIKAVNDQEGTFTGLASVYGVIDLANEVVAPGAFTKTLQGGNKRPLLWQHGPDTPIGLCTLTDSPGALKLEGKFCLDVERAREAYSLLRDGVVTGLSIGYNTMRDEVIGGVRHLKELRLWEVSLVTIPCCEPAQVTGYKSARAGEILRALRNMKSDVLDALEGKKK